MNRNKRETDPVSVIFGSKPIFFYLFRGHPSWEYKPADTLLKGLSHEIFKKFCFCGDIHENIFDFRITLPGSWEKSS